MTEPGSGVGLGDGGGDGGGIRVGDGDGDGVGIGDGDGEGNLNTCVAAAQEVWLINDVRVPFEVKRDRRQSKMTTLTRFNSCANTHSKSLSSKKPMEEGNDVTYMRCMCGRGRGRNFHGNVLGRSSDCGARARRRVRQEVKASRAINQTSACNSRTAHLCRTSRRRHRTQGHTASATASARGQCARREWATATA